MSEETETKIEPGLEGARDVAPASRYFAEAILRRFLRHKGVPEEQLQSLANPEDVFSGILSIPDDIIRMRRLLTPESDRGCALIASSFLEEELGLLLRAFLVPGKATDELLDGEKALATFSSRINACSALGLIGDDAARELHIIRKIRNDFAHEWDELGFDRSPARDRCLELGKTTLRFGDVPRACFTGAVMFLTGELRARRAKVSPCIARPGRPPEKQVDRDFMRLVNGHIAELLGVDSAKQPSSEPAKQGESSMKTESPAREGKGD